MLWFLVPSSFIVSAYMYLAISTSLVMKDLCQCQACCRFYLRMHLCTLWLVHPQNQNHLNIINLIFQSNSNYLMHLCCCFFHAKRNVNVPREMFLSFCSVTDHGARVQGFAQSDGRSNWNLTRGYMSNYQQRPSHSYSRQWRASADFFPFFDIF